MPHRRLDDADGTLALLEGALERALQRRGITLGGGEDRVVDAERGTVADAGDGVLEPDLSALARVERELLELRATQAAVAAEAGHQVFPRIGRRGDLVARQYGGDELREVADAVGIAGHGDRILGALEGAAERRARGEIAPLGDRNAVAR